MLERFGQIGFNSEPIGALRILQYREHEYGNVLEARVPFDRRRTVIPVESRHHHVEDDQVRTMLPDEREALHSVYGFHRVIARLFNDLSHHLTNGRVIIDDQDGGASELAVGSPWLS